MRKTKAGIAFLLLSVSQFLLASIPPMPAMYAKVAKQNKVPASVFYALVLNESRSAVNHKSSPTVLPWPWTINHRGTGHYFPTKQDAHEFITGLIANGDEHFDVGLGQLNWYWHKNKFTSPWAALDPNTNLTVAAKYLRRQFEREACRTWSLAIGCYHRPGQRQKDKKIAMRYRNKVLMIWSRIQA